MEIYHVDDTGPPIDWLLKRDDEVVDPSTATAIVVKVRIKGESSVKFTRTLALGTVSVVEDDDGNNRIRCTFAAGNLDTAGTYQAQAVLTWPSFGETSPDPHEFQVAEAWS